MPQQIEQSKQEQHSNINQEQQQQAKPQQGNQTGIPDNLKASIEYMSGISLADVRVEYNSDKPAQMGAYAYTQGNIIYIAPGQEKHLAHELWHIVQQREGKVKKNTEFQKGVAGNDNKGLEDKAEQQGQKAKQMAKIPDLLPQKELESKKNPQEIVQRAKIEKESHYGKFFVDDAAYDFTTSKKNLDAHISFEPGENTDATKIGLVQTALAKKNGSNSPIDPNEANRTLPDGTSIDRLSDKNTPIYGSDSLGIGKGLEDTPKDNNTSGKPTKLEPGIDRNATYELGHHYKKKPTDANWTSNNAELYDGPAVYGSPNSKLEFETTALALDGTQKGEYYGSVKWGWEKDGSNTLKKIPFDLVSEGMPTKTFLAAAKKWNDNTTRGTLVVKNNNTDVESLTSSAVLFKLQKGDEVLQEATLGTSTANFIALKVTKASDKSLVGKKGSMDITFLEDKGDGGATVDLPLVGIKIPTEDNLQFGAEKDVCLETDPQLPLGTRMKILEEDGEMAKVEIVQGPKTGDQGWVEKAKLKDE